MTDKQFEELYIPLFIRLDHPNNFHLRQIRLFETKIQWEKRVLAELGIEL